MPANPTAHAFELDEGYVVELDDGTTAIVDAACYDGDRTVWLELDNGFASSVPHDRVYILAGAAQPA